VPFNPDLAALLARQLLGIATAAERAILRAVALRLAAGSLGGLRGDVGRIMRAMQRDGLRSLTDSLRTAYLDGARSAAADLPGHPATNRVPPKAIAGLLRAATKQLASTTLRVQSSAGATYRDAAQAVTDRMAAGDLTRRQASALIVRRLADQGVTAFVDKGGRRWELGSYAEMVARTASMQALVVGHVDQLQAAGHDLVMVSDAPEECELCRPWEGTVLSLTGSTKRYATLQRARSAGLFHPNCRHRLVAYIPGVTERFTDTRDVEGDQLRQRQRAYERRVRELARRVEMVQAVDPRGPVVKLARAQLKAKEQEFAAWRAANDRKNLAYRTNLVSR
jgi:hypothetical protein